MVAPPFFSHSYMSDAFSCGSDGHRGAYVQHMGAKTGDATDRRERSE